MMPEKALDMNSILLAITGTIASGVVWLVRKLFVNEKRIALLEQESQYRREERNLQIETMKELQSDLKEISKELRKP